MSDPTVRITVVIFADEDDQRREFEPQGNNVMEYSWQAPSINHFRVGFHVNPAVDRHGRSRFYGGETQVLGQSEFLQALTLLVDRPLPGQPQGLDSRVRDSGNEVCRDRYDKPVFHVLRQCLGHAVRKFLRRFVVSAMEEFFLFRRFCDRVQLR